MTEASNPFRTRTMLLIVAAGLVLALGFLLVSAYGDRFERQRGTVPSPGSRAATGYYGLTRLIALAGGKVTLSNDAADRPERGLLILTPNAATTPDEVTAALTDAAGPNAPVLIVLPKWMTVPVRGQPNREQKLLPIPPERLAAMLGTLAKFDVTQEPGHELFMRTRLPIPEFKLPEPIQTVRTKALNALITTRDGGTVLAKLPDSNVYILADPDLLNNHGLSGRTNARAALALLAALDPDAPGDVIFDTMLPYGAGGRNLLQLAFEPPFAGVSIALLVAALLAGIATLARFGPVRREGRAVPFGKAALIDNIVTLARRAGRVKEGGGTYADAIRDWAARRLALPRTLQGEALDAHLAALDTTTDYAATAAQLRSASSETELLHAAQALDDWRKEVKA